MIYNLQTLYEYNNSTFEESTVGITPSTTEGIFMFFADAMRFLRDRLFR